VIFESSVWWSNHTSCSWYHRKYK